MLPSIIINTAIVAIVTTCIILGMCKTQPRGKLFRYFTVLSNVLAALASAVLIPFACAGGELPQWTLILKYAGTAAVTVTMLTVLCFLGPCSHDWKGLLTGVQLMLHLVTPLLALISFILFEKTALPLWTVVFGVLPVLLYGALYCSMVIFAPEERRWEDFYGFNAKGRWALSFAAMLTATALIAFALWIVPPVSL